MPVAELVDFVVVVVSCGAAAVGAVGVQQAWQSGSAHAVGNRHC